MMKVTAQAMRVLHVHWTNFKFFTKEKNGIAPIITNKVITQAMQVLHVDQ